MTLWSILVAPLRRLVATMAACDGDPLFRHSQCSCSWSLRARRTQAAAGEARRPLPPRNLLAATTSLTRVPTRKRASTAHAVRKGVRRTVTAGKAQRACRDGASCGSAWKTSAASAKTRRPALPTIAAASGAFVSPCRARATASAALRQEKRNALGTRTAASAASVTTQRVCRRAA